MYKNLANIGAEGHDLGFASTHPWNTWDEGYQTRHLFKRCIHLGKGHVLKIGLGLPHPVGRGLQTRSLCSLSAPVVAAVLRPHVGDPPPETLVFPSPVSRLELFVLGAECCLLAGKINQMI